MFKSIERIVSFAANVIAIGLFFAAILGLLSSDFIPEFTPPTYTSAIAIIVMYAALIGYGSASIIKARLENGEPYGFLIILYCLLFCVSAIYLENLLTQNMIREHSVLVAQRARLAAGMAYPAVHFVVYLAGIWFPKGFNVIDYMFSMFRSGFYFVVINLLFYAIAITYLFTNLDDKLRP